MASNLRRSKRTVGRRILDLQTKVSGLQKRVGPVSIGENAVSTASLQPGAVGGWVVDANSIYTGTKTATGSFAPTGSITIGSDGHITANKFRIDANGDAFFTGAISGGTIDIGGSDSSSFHVDADGKMWLGSGTTSFNTATFSVTAEGTLKATSGKIGAFTISEEVGSVGALRTVFDDPVAPVVQLSSVGLFFQNGNDATYDRLLEIDSYGISTTGPGVYRFGVDSATGGALIEGGVSIGYESDFAFVSGAGAGDSEFIGGAVYIARSTNDILMQLKRPYNAGGDFVRFRNGTSNSEVGRIEFTSTTNIAYQTSSDARLKENVQQISNATETIKSIQPVNYNFISEPETRFDGFIAQDLYEVYPQAVSVGGEDPKEKPWAVNYSGVTPLLTAAIKEIIERLENLESSM